MKRSIAWSTAAVALTAAFALGKLWAQSDIPTVTLTCPPSKPVGRVCTKFSQGSGFTPGGCASWSSATGYSCDIVSPQAFTTPRRVTIQ